MKNKDKALGALVVALNGIYLAWLSVHVEGLGGSLLFIAETLIASLSLLFLINHWSQHHVRHTKVAASGSVDIFLPVVNEPLSIFERTLKAATAIEYMWKTIYVLDDGSRAEIKKLAQKYGATYVARSIHNDRKAGNLNFGLEHSDGDFILVLDADQVAKPAIIKDILGYFQSNSRLAIVTLRQHFDVPKNDFNHDTLFYQHMQAGKNADNAAISCGSGVFYRRSALEEINGFQTWNIVEDLYTSYVLHAHGFLSLYINKPYTLGLAPQDLSEIYQQRGTWAVDTLRLFFRRSPLFFKGFTLRQRLHYFEIGWAYIVSATAIPIIFILPIVTMYLNLHIISDERTYILLRVPSLLPILYLYYSLSGNSFSTSQFWASFFPVNMKALALAVLPFKVNYRVTNKLAGVGKRDIMLIFPHLILACTGVWVLVWRVTAVDHHLTFFTGLNMIWIFLMLFWFYPVIKKGLLLE